MVSTLDELIVDINRFSNCKISFRRHADADIEIQTVDYTNLHVEKDKSGKAWVNNEFYISDKYKIIRVEEPEEAKRRVYQITKGNMKIMDIYLYNIPV